MAKTNITKAEVLDSLSPDEILGLLGKAGLSAEEIQDMTNKHNKRLSDEQIARLPGTKVVQDLKAHAEGLGFPVRITIERLKDAEKAIVSVQRPGYKGSPTSGRNGQIVVYGGTVNEEPVTLDGPDEEHPRDFRSFKALCNALLESTGEPKFDAKGQSARIVLERNKVAFTLRDKEEVTEAITA